ncbi:MAG: hypothetical protein Ta2F_16240 [Termitinemataceae bacterium]|nr:MAG: hypothetical protein Ta2F_16240 [Termitinemataceae bacterium]
MAKAGKGGASKTVGSELKKKIDGLGLSVSGVSKTLKQNPTTFKKILDGKSKINVEIALLFAKLFGTTAEFWIDLQKKQGLAEAKKNSKLQKQIKDLKKAVKAPAEKKEAAKKGPKASGKGKKAAVKKPTAKKAVVKKATAKKVVKKAATKKVIKVKKEKPVATSTSVFGSSSTDTSSSW